ncbi:hypothetical protein [Dokdonella fugitiva]|jgi:hypothetical protein|uniref:Metallothionein n=1 Tax=Dokdonella fugitiva TaxID=328517 RepID=A0A4R2HTK8_9GAMM|nr:hypothetical protein [Dokdonella fugitiva]MBA8885752.1 hypothetical protein [Dokdonella fugitiva]TCO34721.1 hypothetical protein EV148_11710 [Dokdonella fugitiva]
MPNPANTAPHAATCAHESCRCHVELGQTYCSPHCANVGVEAPERREDRCGCGHAACAGQARPGA